MHKKLAFYCTTCDVCAAARNFSMARGYTLSYLFVPPFINLDGKDISLLDGGSKAEIYLSRYDESKLNDCDTLFIEYNELYDDPDMYETVINAAKNMGKEIILSRKYGDLFNKNKNDENYTKTFNNTMYDIDVPVITVFTDGYNTDQFSVELALRKLFLDTGYNVLQFGSRELSGLFGFQSIPDFLYGNMDAFDKAVKFNHMLYETVEKDTELIIIGVPDAILKYNNNKLHGLGIAPYIISSSISSDLSVLCTHYNMNSEIYFDEVSKLGKYRFGTPFSFFNISNTKALYDSNKDVIEYVRLSSKYVMENLNGSTMANHIHLLNSLDDGSVKNAFYKIIKDMNENVRAIA